MGKTTCGQSLGRSTCPGCTGTLAGHSHSGTPVRPPVRQPVRPPVRAPVRPPVRAPVRPPLRTPEGEDTNESAHFGFMILRRAQRTIFLVTQTTGKEATVP